MPHTVLTPQVNHDLPPNSRVPQRRIGCLDLEVEEELEPQTRITREKIQRIGLDVATVAEAADLNGFTFHTVIENRNPTPRMFDAACNYLVFPTVIDISDHDPAAMFEAEHRLRTATQNFLIGCHGFPELD